MVVQEHYLHLAHNMNEASIPNIYQSSLWDAVRASLRVQHNAPPIQREDRSQKLSASFAQQRLWFIEELSGPSSQHNLSVALILTGNLNLDALRRGLSVIVHRHESLRTSFKWEFGQLWQIIHPAVDFSTLNQETLEPNVNIDILIKEEAARPFDIAQLPLLRAKLIQKNERDHTLLITFHHMIFDGWSFEVFMRELDQAYRAFSLGQVSPFVDMPIQYVDFSIWQRAWMKGQIRQDLESYWLSKLSNPPAPLIISRNSSGFQNLTQVGNCVSFSINSDLSNACKRLAGKEGLTLFMFLLAAFQTLLFRRSGEEDIIVGVPVANRNRLELDSLIGLLVNTLAIRSRLAGDISFVSLMAQVRQTLLDAYAHQDLPFEMLVEALKLPRQFNRPPLVQIMFSYLNVPKSGWSLHELEVNALNVHNGKARLDLSLTMWEKDGCLGGQLEYDCALFDQNTIESMLDQWRTLLESITISPDFRLDSLQLLSQSQKQMVLDLADGPKVVYPRDTPIHRVFESIADTRRYETALNFGVTQISFNDLNMRSNQLAHYLSQQGVVSGDLIAVCLPTSPEFIVSILATLKLGAAYLPLEPSEPISRINAALRGQRVKAAITFSTLISDVSRLVTSVYMLDQLSQVLAQCQTENLSVSVSATDLAYVMFTSGSTGNPKAVCTPHRGVVRLACAANYAKLSSKEVFLQLSPLAFDLSSFDIWCALLNGGRLVIPLNGKPKLSDVAGLIEQHEVTTLMISTGLFELMMELESGALSKLRYLLVCGDVLSRKHAERYLNLNSCGDLINCYGPTENTAFCTFHYVTRADMEGAIPIGRPLSEGGIYVLDENLNLVPHGVIGNAWLTGDGLMQGYLNNPDESQFSLRPDPFSEDIDAFMYYTGDLVKMRPDGIVDFIGRKDRQLKIRGYRMEPAEIEAICIEDPRVLQACVTVRAEGVNKTLQVYVVIAPDYTDLKAEILQDLNESFQVRLPEPLRPSGISVVKAFPLNVNGKVDRLALRHDVEQSKNDVSDAPKDEIEQQVADLYCEVLQLNEIGRNDSFFEIGGHSLLALQLIGRLEKSFELKLPLVSLFEYATPARMAAFVRTQVLPAAVQIPGVVEIRRGQSKAAIFLVPGGYGRMLEMTMYAQVMKHLSHDINVFGLLADGINGIQSLPNSVSDMVSAYLERIKVLQPSGPYLVVGECIGGSVAYEIAQQLHRQGDRVFVILLDVWCPTDRRMSQYYRWENLNLFRLNVSQRWSELRAACKDFWGALVQQFLDRPAFHPKRTLQYFIAVGKAQIRIARSWYNAIETVHQPTEEKRAITKMGKNYILQAMRYRPLASAIPLNLIISTENKKLGIAADWQQLAICGLNLWVVPGTHEAYLRETPDVSAKIIDTCLHQILNSEGYCNESS